MLCEFKNLKTGSYDKLLETKSLTSWAKAQQGLRFQELREEGKDKREEDSNFQINCKS